MENRKKTIFFYALDCCMLLVLLYMGMRSLLWTVIPAAVISFSYLFRRESSVVGSMLFFYPFYCMFKVGTSGMSYYNIMIIFAVISLVINREKKAPTITVKRALRIDLSILALFVVYLATVLLIQGGSSYMEMLLDFVLPMLLIVAMVNKRKHIDVPGSIRWFAAGVVIAGLIGAEIIPVQYLSDYVSVYHYRVAGIRLSRYQGLTVNPNYFSLDINLAIAGLLVLPDCLGGKRSKLDMLLIAALGAIGLMTLSKSFILTLVLTVLVYTLLTNSRRTLRKNILLLAAGMAVLAVVIVYGESNYVNAILDRLSSADNLEGLTTGRTAIWLKYWRYCSSNLITLFLGQGVGAGRPMLDGVRMSASHSFYVECLYYFGLIGSVLFFVIMWHTLVKSKIGRYGLLVLFVFMVRGFAINIVLREAFATEMMIVALFLQDFAARQEETEAIRGIENAQD